MYQEGLNQTVNSIFDESCRRWGRRVALVEGDRSWTYLELRREVAVMTKGLQDAGLTSKDRVAFLTGVTSDWAVLFYSLLRIGAVAVPMNMTWVGREIKDGLALTEATVLVATEEFRGQDYVKRAVVGAGIEGEAGHAGAVTCADLPFLRTLISVEGSSTHAHLAASLPELVAAARGSVTTEDFVAASAEVTPQSHCIYLLTSGTSTFPKPVIHSHETLMVGVANYADGVEADKDDSNLIIAPNYHVAAYFNLIMMHLRGGQLHVMPFFEPRAALKIIEREQISLIFGFDVHFLMLKRDPMFGMFDFSSITRTMIGSSPASFDEIAEMGITHQGNIYGSSEYLAAQSFFPYRDRHDIDRMRNSHGRPGLGTQIKIADPVTGEEVPVGNAGEICVRGPALFKGYYNMPEESAKAFDADGFFHSGDIGWVDAEGYVFYRGREKETVKTGGENVSMQEVELFLQLETPWISKALVVGRADSRWGEIVCAIVELRSGAEVTEGEIIEFCRGKLAGYKVPKKIIFAGQDDWSFTPTGKLDRRAMVRWMPDDRA